MNEVSVEWLRRATEVLLRHLEETQGPRIELKQDLFWSMASVNRYDVTTEPNAFTVGSLTDGAEFVQSMVQNGAVLNYGLIWLGELLRAIGSSPQSDSEVAECRVAEPRLSPKQAVETPAPF